MDEGGAITVTFESDQFGVDLIVRGLQERVELVVHGLLK